MESYATARLKNFFEKHVLLSEVRFSPYGFYVHENGRRYHGVTRVMKEMFYSKAPFMGAPVDKRNSSSEVGKKLGTQIDREMDKYIKKEKSHGSCHAITKNILKALAKNNFTPIVSQYLIHDKNTRVATMIDFVCYNRITNTIQVMELKTGFCKTWDVFHKRHQYMDAPLDNVTCTPRKKAHLQAYLGKWILDESYKCPEAVEAWVVRADFNGCTLTRVLDKEFRPRMPAITALFAENYGMTDAERLVAEKQAVIDAENKSKVEKEEIDEEDDDNGEDEDVEEEEFDDDDEDYESE